ncbi:MAG TPA: nickel pincer cofactor biosynthesis protein LarB [Candidatus Hydrogenedentes bacterium]|nr:nickel pincer cofactor biosynthesis protein LarB [Candidatus Hydrogenedentota bacterium]HIJ72788.1 nickel pincer cofactor biosynthesis protein LarB [Candidatus Hydrogenedentota bacterium]
MDKDRLRGMLESVASGELSPDEAVEKLRALPFEDLGFAKVDHHRPLRKGYPETVFCAGKTAEQVVAIVTRMREHGSNVLATRCTPEVIAAILEAHPDAVHHEAARAVAIAVNPPEPLAGYVAVVCAGTSDIPVAEEAAVACESLGNVVERVYDVGVAGIHRLFDRRDTLERAAAIVVCAGMEGALASVVAGLVDKPVIAVPTSVGYGASFGGIAALLGMLNSCATGVCVVNIDNGFGAGMFAGIINRIANGKA